MTEQEKKQYISENGNQLIENMLQHIGHPDAEIRDHLNYRLFIELLNNNHLTHSQMKEIIFKLEGKDFLFASIGERNTDSIFIRSFSALWLSALLTIDGQQRFLKEDEAIQILTSCSLYLMKEKDIRGFVPEKGWAHSIAHGADLATAIIAHPAFQLRLAPNLLQGIKDSFWKGAVYVDDEDERLVNIVAKLIQKDFPEEVLIEWVEQVFDKLQLYLMQEGYTPQYFTARTNTLQFMKTLYFTLKFSQKLPELKGVTSLFIGKWMKQ